MSLRRTLFAALVALLLGVSLGSAPATAAGTTMTELVQGVSLIGPPTVGPTAFGAHLTSAGAPISGAVIVLKVLRYGTTTAAEYSAVTDAAGYAEREVNLQARAVISWVYAGDGTYAASTATPITWRVAPIVVASYNDHTLRIGQLLVVRGRTRPARAGNVVKLWTGANPYLSAPVDRPRGVPARMPRVLARAIIRADGSYRIVHRFSSTGARELFVTVSPGGGTERGGTSDFAFVTVRPR